MASDKCFIAKHILQKIRKWQYVRHNNNKKLQTDLPMIQLRIKTDRKSDMPVDNYRQGQEEFMDGL